MFRTLGSRCLDVGLLWAAALACRGAAAPDGGAQTSSAGSAVVEPAAATPAAATSAVGPIEPGHEASGTAAGAAGACPVAPGKPQTVPLQALASPALDTVWQALVPLVKDAQTAALGLRPWDSASDGRAGATYELSRYRLGPAACDVEIQAVLASINQKARPSNGWASSVRPLSDASVTALAAGLSAWPRRTEEEQACRHSLRTSPG